MRLLLVANGYPPAARGGVETYTQAIANALQARGHAVEVFCRVAAAREPEYTLQRERVEGIAVRRVVNDLTDATQFESHYRNPHFDTSFRQHVQDCRAEVVHVQHGLGLSATLLSVAKAMGLPVLVTLHDYWFICPRATLFTAERTVCAGPQGAVDCINCLGGASLGPGSFFQHWPIYKWLLARLPARANRGLRSRLDRPTAALAAAAPERQRHRRQMDARTDYLLRQLRQADVRLAPSEFVKAVYVAHGLAAEHIEVLPLGIGPVAVDRAARTPQSGLVIGYIGSLQYHKGPDVLVNALRAAGPAVSELRLYGQGDQQDVYLDDVRAMAASDERIRMMGTFRPEALPDILSQMDVLVVPSRSYETYSLAAREALLAGVPVIASNLGALPEAVHDGVNGYLVPPDDVAALATALGRASVHWEDLHAGTRLNRSAPGLEEHVDRLESIYEALRARSLAARGS